MGLKEQLEAIKRRISNDEVKALPKQDEPARPATMRDIAKPTYKQDIEEFRRKQRGEGNSDEFWSH